MSGSPQGNVRILVVEDDGIVRENITAVLEEEGYGVREAASVEDALEYLENGYPRLIITDLRFSGRDGIDLLDKARQDQPNVPVLMITAHGSVDTAVAAMRKGAFHYLQKPVSVDVLLAEVQKALEHGRVLKEREDLRRALSQEKGVGRILGQSLSIRALRDMIVRVAATDSTVLITGETGTGKELVANALHYESNRAGEPYIRVNCAALTETLLESELFGHEKGAYTSANERRAGRFERANHGTLFLDEISEMGAHVQAKLLRVLQGSEFERVGGQEPIDVDVRVVAATNRNPEEEVKKGNLRQDLFYRLNIVQIECPPLRERTEDIPVLVRGFVSVYSSRHGKNLKGVSRDAMAVLATHEWPGNVRELENAIERAVVLAQGESIEVRDLPPPLSGETGNNEEEKSADKMLNLQEVEKRAILKALEICGWNKAQASERLGIYPASLYKKMKRLGIPLQPDE